MRKFALVFVVLLSMCSAVSAHVSAVRFPEIGSLRDAADQAAFGIFQTYSVPALPQVTCNIVTGTASVGGPCASPAAVCNGDVQTLTRTVTTNSGSKILTTSAGSFTAVVDVGKTIIVPGWNNAATGNYNVISTVDSPTQVTLVNNALTNLAAVSRDITFGTSDSAAFAAFNTWALANQGSTNQVVLTVPGGSNCWFGTNVSGNWASGISNLIVEGTGATLNSVNGSAFQLAGSGICARGLTQATGCSARIQTANPGDSTVTLTAASLAAGYTTRFNAVANQWIMIGGLDIQGQFQTPGGQPPNNSFFEWRQVTNVNVGTGVITLDRPLTNFYSSSWPNFNEGNAFEMDQGGSATIWNVGGATNNWNTTVEYRGLTISQTGQTYAQGRNVTYRNVTFTGANGGIPTQNETWSAINSDFSGVIMETDKLVGTMLLDGVTIIKIVNQSASTDRLIIRNSTFTSGLDGGAKTTEISDTNLTGWAPGIYAYGSLSTSNSTTCTRCTISSVSLTLGASDAYSTPSFWTKASGVITMPNAAAQGSGPGQRYFVPGSPGSLVYYYTTSTNPPTAFSCCETLGSLQISTMTADPWPATDNKTLTTTVNISSASKNLNVPSAPFVSGDVGKSIIVNGAGSGGGLLRTFITAFSSATDVTLFNAAGTTVAGSSTVQWGTSNTYITTNQSGGFVDTTAFNSSNLIGLKTIATPNITCDVCNAGDPTSDGYGISIQAGATTAKPLGAYVSKQYTPTSAQGNLATILNRGIFKSLSINVTVAATAAGSVTLQPGGQFHWVMASQNTPTAPTLVDWLPANFFINLKQIGNRVITPSGVTCDTGGGPVAGGCSGDTITPPANMATMWITSRSMTPYMGSAFTGAPTFTITMQTDPIQ